MNKWGPNIIILLFIQKLKKKSLNSKQSANNEVSYVNDECIICIYIHKVTVPNYVIIKNMWCNNCVLFSCYKHEHYCDENAY